MTQRKRPSRQPQFPLPELHINHEEHTHLHLLSKSTLYVILGNAWLIAGVAMPVCRPADALVSFIAAGVCFVLAAMKK